VKRVASTAGISEQIASRPDVIVPGHDPEVFIKLLNPDNGVARIQ